MRLNEFNKQVTAATLNESAASMFGQRINLESFTVEKLEDVRNKIRTKLSQFEQSQDYNAVYEDETYSKNKLFLDVINKELEERLAQPLPEMTALEQMVLDQVNEGVIDFNSLPDELQKKAQQIAYIRSVKSKVAESIITEGGEEKAELIMAARDMVDRITGWMEDTANMQAESMLELVDSIRDELGQDLAMEFESSVKPALATIYTALETSRQQLTQGVGLLTGEGGADMMGMDAGMDDMGSMDDLDAEVPGDDLDMDPEDEFAADAAAAGGDEEAGRPTRESVEYSRQLGKMLAPKKK